MTIRKCVVGIGLMCLLLAAVARSQENAQLTGIITDPNAAVIPGASVSLIFPATGEVRHTAADNAGIYTFSNLRVGVYTLTVSASGFQTYSKTNIVINVASTVKEDVPLTVGSNTQTVTVQADALQLQSETNEVSDLITGKQITELATNGRNVTQLAVLGLGVSNNLPSFNGINALTAGTGISFDGTRPGHNVYMIDGSETYDRGCGGCFTILPSLDALSEFKTLDSNYSPDYGVASGGTITMVVKSGTSDLHGGVWEFNRNDAFDANNYISNLENQAKPELRLNIFGGNIGGPLTIPHLYNTNRKRTFFFVNEEWRRLVTGTNPTVTPTVPASDFPAPGEALVYTPPANGTAPVVPATSDPAKLQLYAQDGLTPRQPFPHNTIPANLLDQNAVLFMGTGAIPKPNASNGSNSFITSLKQPTYVREDLVRVDHTINSKMALMGHYIHDAVSQQNIPSLWSDSSYPTAGSAFSNPAWSAVVQLAQTISPNLLNETSFIYNGSVINLSPTGIYAQPPGWSATSLFPNNSQINKLPEIDLGAPYGTNYSTSYYPWQDAQQDYQERDDLSWTRGKHNFKFGGSFMRFTKNMGLQAEPQGTYVFSTPSFSGDAYVNFLLGFASSYSQLNEQSRRHLVNNTPSFYALDNYKVTPRLTLNLGLRYDGYPHAYERQNQLSNFVQADYNPAQAAAFNADGSLNTSGPGFTVPAGYTTPFYMNGIQLPGTNGLPRGLVNNYWLTFQPRVGFALDVYGRGSTVLRGGFGVFYERIQGNDIYPTETNTPVAFIPTATNVQFSNPSVSALTGLSSPTPYFPASLASLALHYPSPGTAEYSLGIQQQLAPAVIAVVQYVGTTGWHQDIGRNINTLPLGSPYREGVATGTYNSNLARIFPGFSNISQYSNDTNQRYNSLQAGLQMQNKHGLSVQLSYTWSHELDVESNDVATISDPFNPRYDYGSGSLDRRNIFTANVIYNLPFFLHADNALLRTALGGWEISDVNVQESGVPTNVTYSPDTLGLGGGTTNRPNLVGSVTGPKSQKQFFNTTSFAPPVAPWDGGPNQGFGDARKDSITGPGINNFNIALFKSFNLTTRSEGPVFQFRVESFNTFNHTQFLTIDAGYTDSTFGQVTAAQDPRVLQFGGKLLF
jgi:Carboxypeptidase regulatory-like domain